MKIQTKFVYLVPPLAVAVHGLRRALYLAAVDEKGLLVSGHPLSLALWAAVLCGAVLIAAAVWKLDGAGTYADNFKAAPMAALAHLWLALVIGRMVLRNDFQGMDRIALLLRVVGAVTVPGLVWAGVDRFRGRKPFFLVHAGLTVFLLLYLISWYQVWSANPQMQDYVFDLLGGVALVLFGYQLTAFEADRGNRRLHLAMGLLAVLLCAGALAGPENFDLYGAGMIWAATDLCRVIPPKKDEVEVHDPA